MQYCNRCKVSVSGNKKCCPLCQGTLTDDGEPARYAFPILKKEKHNRLFWLRLLTFIDICVIVICFTVNLIVTPDFLWAVPVLIGVSLFWGTAALAIKWRTNILKNITTQLVILTLLIIFVDWYVGFRGWSLAYVFPGACILAIVSTIFIMFLRDTPVSECLLFLSIQAVYGLIPAIFIACNWLSFPYIAIGCVAASLIALAAILLFKGKDFIYEVRKSFHI